MISRLPPRDCRFELLEPRLCLSADLGTRLLEWNGQQVAAHADAWIVRASSPQIDVAAFAAAVHASVQAAVPAELAGGWRATDLGEGFWALSAPGASVQQVWAWAANTTWVDYVEPDYVITGQAVPDDPSFGQLWGLHNTGQSGGVVDADIDAPEAWNVTTGSRDVVIAVIDTGVDYTHPDLAANIWRNPGEIPGDGLDNDGNGFVDDVFGWDFVNLDADPLDDEGHGTHVAGTIGAVGNNGIGVTGVAWNVSIMPLKFLDANGSGSTSGAIAALNYATRMRRDFGINVVATNNSWGGGGFSSGLRDAIEAGGRAGILFVAAAGNDANDNDASPSYPASYTSNAVISVAATTRSNQLASFSSYGLTSVDIGAPGQQIYSTLPGNAYGSYSGTSMAAPHVAGTIALVASAVPTATAAQIRSAILSSAVPVPALAGKVATGGLLNAAAALAALTGMPVDSTPEETDPAADSGVVAPPVVVADVGDALGRAARINPVAAAASAGVRLSGSVGDGSAGRKDVDMYRLALRKGERLVVDVDAVELPGSSTLDSYLRLFNSSGRQLASNDDSGGSTDSLITFTARKAGTYYVGVSGFGNASYAAKRAGSGRPGSIGGYEVSFTIGGGTPGSVGGPGGGAVRILGFSDDLLAERLRQQVAFAALATGWLGGSTDIGPKRPLGG